jgi:hypothetical protein
VSIGNDLPVLMSQVARQVWTMIKHDPCGDDRTLATSYVTGHKPKETIEQMLARINATCFVGDMPPHFGSAKKGGRREKKHKMVKLAEKLTVPQLRLTIELLKGERASLTCEGHDYAVKRLPDGSWSICSLDAEGREHIVDPDGNCSCEDHRFRKHDCKHMLALRSIR